MLGPLSRDFRKPRSWAGQMAVGIGEVPQAKGASPAQAWERVRWARMGLVLFPLDRGGNWGSLQIVS